MRTMIATLAVLFVAGTALPARAGNDQPLKALAPESQPAIRCPVMGAIVQDPSVAARSEYQGRTYHFCCAGCKPAFDADPARYAAAAEASPSAVPVPAPGPATPRTKAGPPRDR